MFKLPFFQDKTKHLSRFALYPLRFRFFFFLDGNWEEGKVLDSETFEVDNIPVKISGLSAFLILYRNGQFVYESKSFKSYPNEITDIEIKPLREIILNTKELTEGNHLFEVTFEKSTVIESRTYHKTIITNLSDEPAKIMRFGAIAPFSTDSDCFINVNNDFFDGVDFNTWYMDTTEHWIQPNQAVFDPVNYGGENWAFEIELKSGKICWFSSLKLV